MRKLRWLMLPAALFWLTAYEAQSLDRCLAETTVDCALDEAVAVAVSLEDRSQRSIAFSYIARVQADTGREAAARETIQKVLTIKRNIMDPNTQNRLDSNIARVHALLGDPAQGLEIAEGIGNPGRLVMTYAWIAQSQAMAGDRAGVDRTVSKALAVAEDIPQQQLASPFAQLAIAKSYIGDREEALAIADSALKLSGKFNSDLIQARLLTVVAVAENAAGAQGRTRKSLDRAREFLAGMESANAPAKELASLLAYLAWAQALTGDREGALASLEPLKQLIREGLDPYSQSSQLAATALVLAKAE